MKINVLDDVKTLNERGLNLFNKDEQLEVANLQEQVKNYLEKNNSNIVVLKLFIESSNISFWTMP